jgi:hydrogenase expression/formation protein HypD
VGFETTAPTIAASIQIAREMNLSNFFVFCTHKLVPPALNTLMQAKETKIDGFILPGHVSVIIGTKAYRPFFQQYKTPCVIAGFEPIDVLQAIFLLIEQIETDRPKLTNGYRRAVSENGNLKAQQIMKDVFDTVDARWRGIGIIAKSGLRIKEKFAVYDAARVFSIETADSQDPKGCACGEILTGLKIPPECPLYIKTCTPMEPVGPCMVSSEGTCAAYYRYHGV